jgi:hypothetical protein
MSEPNDMSCAQLHEVAAELALGVLTGRERAAALAHLDYCEDCREEVQQLMETSGQLLGLLPPAEPPAGFETRVLARLGLPVPPPEAPPWELSADPAGPSPGPDRDRAPGRRRPDQGAPPAGPGRARRGRLGRRARRALATAGVAVAVIAAGLGGWRIGAGPAASTASSAAGSLSAVSLLSADHQEVGTIYLFSGTQRWLYMSVDLGGGDEAVTCQVIATDGRVTTVGSFRVNGGYGGWGSPDPVTAGTPSSVRLVTGAGSVLASATFPR